MADQIGSISNWFNDY